MVKTLKELLEDYNNGIMPSDDMDGFVPFYPTEEHKKDDLVGHLALHELPKIAKFSNDLKKLKDRFPFIP